MPRPLTLSPITDLAIGETKDDILSTFADALLSVASLIIVYMNRESVDVTAQIKIGSDEVFPLGPSAVNATIGDTPSTQNDEVVRTIGRKGEQVQIIGNNVNAAAQELRATVLIIPLSDLAKVRSLVPAG